MQKFTWDREKDLLIAKPGMVNPKERVGNGWRGAVFVDGDAYDKAVAEYAVHIASLPQPIKATDEFKNVYKGEAVDREYELDKDFELRGEFIDKDPMSDDCHIHNVAYPLKAEQESQDDLWNEVIELVETGPIAYERRMAALKQNFTITRINK